MLKACFSSQILQVALCSCICQLQAQRPQERVSLPWVHVAYQHFRSRLQNFSRILTTYPQVLQMLLYNVMGTVRNDRLDGPEMVWPLPGSFVFTVWAWPSWGRWGAGGGCFRGRPGREAPGAVFCLGDPFPGPYARLTHKRQEHI